MIDKLRKQMIAICGSVLVVVFFLLAVLTFSSMSASLEQNMDNLLDFISEENGLFQLFDRTNIHIPRQDRLPGNLNEDMLQGIRFFAVWTDNAGTVRKEKLSAFPDLTTAQAHALAQEALGQGDTSGWLDNYRYKIYETAQGRMVMMLDGSLAKYLMGILMAVAAAVPLVLLTVIMLLVILVSKAAVKPIADSYEKQRQFVTDASHELKTPLTLILANLDILEAEAGKSEWIDDIRTEGHRMNGLVTQLTALSRLDEADSGPQREEFSLSETVEDTVSEFSALAQSRGLTLTGRIEPELSYRGDEGAIRQLGAILLDNAVKYCDPGGDILVTLEGKRHPVLTVENSFLDVDSVALERLFDRFYRADKARTAGSGFGIGLSLAKAIVESHRGDIRAVKSAHGRIAFRVTLK